jgi:hypothetical protein
VLDAVPGFIASSPLQGASHEDQPLGGSSRSIPLADLAADGQNGEGKKTFADRARRRFSV